MKKVLLPLAALAVFAAGFVSAAETPDQRFYGTITSIQQDQKSFTAHNKKRNADLEVKWNAETSVISNKKPIRPSDLKVGEFIMVAYVADGGANTATRISVRPKPGKKKNENTNQ